MRSIKTIFSSLCIACFLATLGAFAYYGYYFFITFQKVTASLTEAEKSPSPNVSQLLITDKDVVNRFTAARIAYESYTVPELKHADWHFRTSIFQVIALITTSPEERLSYFLHFMQFRGGTGIEYGAQKYFNKIPSALTDEEIMGLSAISVSPSRFSPENKPENYKAALAKKLQQLSNIKRVDSASQSR